MSDSFATPWTVAHQAPLSMEFPSKNTGVGCHFLLQGNLPYSGIKPRSSALQADSLPSEPQHLPTLCVQCWIKQIRILVSFRANKSDMGERTYRFNINEVMYQIRSDQISRSVVSNSLQPHELQHARPPCPSPTPGVHSDSRPSSQRCHPAISSSVAPFSSCPQSLPASGSFPVNQHFP